MEPRSLITFNTATVPWRSPPLLIDAPRLLDRGGQSHQRSSSRSSSADAAIESKSTRLGTKPKRLGGGAGGGDDSAKRATRDEGDAFSLPLISGGGNGGQQQRRKPRHVSTFRERILEERRARKEVRKIIGKEPISRATYAYSPPPPGS